MNKISQFKSAWPTAYNLIREMGLMKDLPPMNKIKLDDGLPDNSGAFGFVTTEDSDNNGTLDTMHIVVPNIDRHLQGINASELQKLKIENPERLKQILMPIVELIAHEQGHQKDYRHGEDNPFPGGEQVADQAAQQALNQISTQATNNINKNDIKRSFVMRKEIISRLVKLAGDLDEKKAFDLSDEVTQIAEKFAQEWPMSGRKFQFSDWMTSDVPFDWGQYEGAQAGEAYYVASNRGSGELGSVQFPGDPYTYEPAGEGRLMVVSGPERGRDSIGRVIEDPRGAKAPAEPAESQQPSVAPTQTVDEVTKHWLGDPAKARENQMGKLDSDIRSEGAKLEKIDRNVELILSGMGFRGQSLSTVYSRAVNSAQKIQALERGIDFLAKEGYDTAELEGQLAKLRTISQNYTELLMERRKLRESPADDAAMDLQPQSADDGAEEKEAEAGLKADELTKNASLNAVFWKPNTKTPFGR